MRAYRSQQLSRIQNPNDLPQVCGVPVLPLVAGSYAEGPCTILPTEDFRDIVAEAIDQFRFNILLKNRFDLHTSADTVLVYLMLWIQRCVAVADGCTSQPELEKQLTHAAEEAMPNPGDGTFQMNQFFTQPVNEKEKKLCAQYLRQLRVETARRLAVRIWDAHDNRTSKWWTQYMNVDFMGIHI